MSKKAPITIIKENFASFADAVEQAISDAPHSEQCNHRLGFACSPHCWKNYVDIQALRKQFKIEAE